MRALTLQQTVDNYEIVVVDSSSATPPVALIEEFPEVIWLIRNERMFPGAARNLGVCSASGDVFAFLDADCIPCPGWIDVAVGSIREGQKFIGGPILDLRPVNLVSWVDNRMQFADFQSGRPAGWIKHVPSCNMVVVQSVFEEAGGFSETTLSGEDVLFTLNVTARHPKLIWFNPSLKVYHRGRFTVLRFLEHQYLLGFYRGFLGLFLSNIQYRLGKNPVLVWLTLPVRLLYMGIRVFRFDVRSSFLFIISLPLMSIGLLAWGRGFYQGIKQRTVKK